MKTVSDSYISDDGSCLCVKAWGRGYKIYWAYNGHATLSLCARDMSMADIYAADDIAHGIIMRENIPVSVVGFDENNSGDFVFSNEQDAYRVMEAINISLVSIADDDNYKKPVWQVIAEINGWAKKE